MNYRTYFINSFFAFCVTLLASIFLFGDVVDCFSDSDADGWTDEEELTVGTDPFDEKDPWDSDGDGIPDYLEFEAGTDPLNPKDPSKTAGAFLFAGKNSKGLLQRRKKSEIKDLEISPTAASVATTQNSEDISELLSNWSFTFSGDVPAGLTVTPQVSQIISGPYEITTVSFGFSGSAPYHQKKFSGAFSFTMPAGNLTEISVSSDDTATVNAGGCSASSKLFKPASVKSPWNQTPPDTMAVTGVYETIGGPYNLNVKIVVKSSLRMLQFYSLQRTPYEIEASAGKAVTLIAEEEKSIRDRFGCGEATAWCEVINWKSKRECVASKISVEEEFVSSTYEMKLNTRFTRNNQILLRAEFDDGEILEREFEIKIPAFEDATEVDEDLFKGIQPDPTKLINYGGNPYCDGHYFFVRIYPQDVSFNGLYHWENDAPETKTGLFNMLASGTTHAPSAPYQLNNLNACTDTAYFSVNFSDTTIENAAVDNDGLVGKLIWPCPVRWKLDNPGVATKNSLLQSDGTLPQRRQIIELRKSRAPLLQVNVVKTFGD